MYSAIMYDAQIIDEYLDNLIQMARQTLPRAVEMILDELMRIHKAGRNVFLCGNGGSGANALHIENDLSIGIQKISGLKLSFETLGANSAVSTALANDYSYAEIFARQLALKAKPGDLLIVYSGSGNSANIIEVLKESKRMGVRSCAVLGFDGGQALKIADISIHFPINDMQISEDLQLILGHLILRQFEKRVK